MGLALRHTGYFLLLADLNNRLLLSARRLASGLTSWNALVVGDRRQIVHQRSGSRSRDLVWNCTGALTLVLALAVAGNGRQLLDVAGLLTLLLTHRLTLNALLNRRHEVLWLLGHRSYLNAGRSALGLTLVVAVAHWLLLSDARLVTDLFTLWLTLVGDGWKLWKAVGLAVHLTVLLTSVQRGAYALLGTALLTGWLTLDVGDLDRLDNSLRLTSAVVLHRLTLARTLHILDVERCAKALRLDL